MPSSFVSGIVLVKNLLLVTNKYHFTSSALSIHTNRLLLDTYNYCDDPKHYLNKMNRNIEKIVSSVIKADSYKIIIQYCTSPLGSE